MQAQLSDFITLRKASKWEISMLFLALIFLAGAFWAPYGFTYPDVSRFGDCSDVPEALARDMYVAQCFLPYEWQVFALHALALFSLLAAIAVEGRIRFITFIIFGGWVVSVVIGLVKFSFISILAG